MDSCFALIGAHQHAIAVGFMNVENPRVSKTLYWRGEWKHSFKRQARCLSRVGCFSRALAFRSLDYPWGKMGTICSLPLTRQIRSQVMVLSYPSTFTSPASCSLSRRGLVLVLRPRRPWEQEALGTRMTRSLQRERSNKEPWKEGWEWWWRWLWWWSE